jgi:dihydropteroate synthase
LGIVSTPRESAQVSLDGVVAGGRLPVVVIGALNVSPESFYPGSVHSGDDLVRAADAMVAAGASIIDVGGMSTAPYLAGQISETEEADRLASAVDRIARKLDVPVSADTARAVPFRAALDAGATILNDVTGLLGDLAMAPLARDRAAGVILMASPAGLPAKVESPVAGVAGALARSLEIARAAGILDDRIALDPGIGFFREQAWPWHEWDTAVIAGLGELQALGRPLCVGISRKSFIGALTGRTDPADRLAGSLAATAIAVHNGAALVRTHDVGATLDAVRVASAVLG